MKRYKIIFLILPLILAACVQQSQQQPAATQSTSIDGQVLQLSASITNRTYTPLQFDVPFGTTVELTVTNYDNEQHGLSLSDFGVQNFVGPLQTKTVRFVANRRGLSATFCSINHPEKLIINVI